MTRHVMLNNVAHKDLRVVTRYAAEFGDNVGTMMIVPTEFADVQREYPIFFRKDPTSGEYSSFALLGLSKDENLFLEDGEWKASYVPGILARGPFLIGFQERREAGDAQREAVIHVDLDHPRISSTDGEPVFLPEGGNSRYLERIVGILNGIRTGLEVNKAMFDAFTEADLIEPIKIEIKLNSEVQYDLHGMYTISQKKLAELNPEALHKLNRSGFLHGAFLVVASLGNVQRLIEMKGRRRQRQAASAS